MTTLRKQAYRRWRHMIERCANPMDREYRYYGARGISVCEEWLASFDAYYVHIGDRPAPGLSIDRIDNDGNYEPGNVRWATAKQQAQNRRRRLLPTHCPQGHLFDESNTRYYPSVAGRTCRTCGVERSTAAYQKRKAAGYPRGKPKQVTT